MEWDGSFDIENLRAHYHQGSLSPTTVARRALESIEAYAEIDPSLWIVLIPPEEVLNAAKALEQRWPDRSALPPLFGVPFAIKDNMDLEEYKTTAGCAAFAYEATKTATVVQRLLDAGALLLGKANMDQFATGLTGMRSPYGCPHSVYSKKHITGGSSSGSAAAMGARLLSFTLGTDTAASGRVPAAFNGCVGFKPSRGSIPNTGIVPACPSIDCVAIFARTCQDARTVWKVAQGYDSADPYSAIKQESERASPRMGEPFKFAVPPADILAICEPAYQRAFENAIRNMESIGGVRVSNFDYAPFHEAGQLLFGPLVAERVAALSSFLLPAAGGPHPSGGCIRQDGLHPVTRQVLSTAEKWSAVDAFSALHKLAALRRRAALSWKKGEDSSEALVDVVLTPTAPFHPTREEVQREPISTGSQLGIFSQCTNLLDLCAVALPSGEVADPTTDRGNRPFGVTVMAPKWHEEWLLQLGSALGA